LKLYEMMPFSDPVKEKERQNAINAKKNRDLKKSLECEALGQIGRLRALNKRLNKKAAADKRKLLSAKKEIKHLKQMLESSKIQAS